MATPREASFDYLLVGGGLANALIALAVFEQQPRARVALIEQGATLGGNHVWCFHAGDVDGVAHGFVAPLVTARWPRYDVSFPKLARTIERPYAAVSSERLDRVLREAFLARPDSLLLLEQRAVASTARSVELASGRTLRASVVIESRGPQAFEAHAGSAFQKFLGLELELLAPSPIQHPMLMDARVEQRDGFRFLYALPLAPDRVLLEDTYFSESPAVDRARLAAEIRAYARAKGFEVGRVLREELGCLPLPTRSVREQASADGPLVAGYQGGWFHPVTGYSFPVAARLARVVGQTPAEQLRETAWPALQREQRRQLRFCLLLNRLFFDAFAPADRYSVIERFYRLPPEVVQRFYAMTTTPSDRARILCGRPPRGFSVLRALGMQRPLARSSAGASS